MGLFNKKVKGYIEYLGLQDWWDNFLSLEERNVILKSLPKIDNGLNLLSVESLIKKKILSFSATKVQLISSIIQSGFEYPEMRDSIKKVLDEISNWELIDSEFIDLHFFYSGLAKKAYKLRNDIEYAVEDAIFYCESSINLSVEVKEQFLSEYPKSPLPSHYCYKQLAIIFEKQKKYEHAIELCMKANRQGWAGDNWEKRIEKLKYKLEKRK